MRPVPGAPSARVSRRGTPFASLWLVLLWPVAASAQVGTVGALRGTVYDGDFGVPLESVRVHVVEERSTAVTSPDGTFVFDAVRPGSYTVVLRKDGYERETRTVIVTPGRVADLEVELAAVVVDMDEFVVTGEDPLGDGEIGALELRAEAISLQDSISSELIGKAGVSDVAGALELVVGASVVEGKYATVRGLGDRYTGTTLNGVRIPSADPRRRAVQVDLFPTGTIEKVTVTKTFTPDLQGDFTGGGIDIETKSIPDGPLFELSLSSEYDSRSTGSGQFLSYAGGGVRWLGFDDGDRDLPDGADDPLPGLPSFFRPGPDDLAASQAYDVLVRSFDPTMGVRREAPEPNQSFSIVLGDSYNLGRDLPVGVIGALTYSHKYDLYANADNNDGRRSAPGQPIFFSDDRVDSRGSDEVLVGLLGSVVMQPSPGHELSLDVIVNQSAEDEARIQVEELGPPTLEQNQSLRYTERRVASTQLHGTHELGRWSFDWVAADNFNTQDQPDVRFFRNFYDTESLTSRAPSNSTEPQNTRRIFRTIREDNLQGAANVAFRFVPWGERDAELQAGLFYETTDREYDQLSFFYSFPGQVGGIFSETGLFGQFTADDPDDLWTDHFHVPDRIGRTDLNSRSENQLLWVLRPVGEDVDYTGDQEVRAGYAMIELPLTASLDLIAGARIERTELGISPSNEEFGTVEAIERQPNGGRVIVSIPQDEAAADVTDSQVLPSLGLVYTLPREMKLRASASRTLARPTFRELAPVAAEEFIFGDEFLGNPELRLSSITNYDLRWEWFRRAGEVLAASLFYKEIEDPIELVSFAASNRSFVQPVNFETGTLLGAELEVRTALDLVDPGRTWLADLTVGANFSYIDSEVDVPLDEQESLVDFGLAQETRRLQGQPEYLLNANVSYDNERLGTSAGLFYDLVGDTLVTGAARGTGDGVPNVFERSFGTLDFTFEQKIGQRLSLRFKARNLLTPDRTRVYRVPEGDEAIESRRETALRLSVGASWSW